MRVFGPVLLAAAVAVSAGTGLAQNAKSTMKADELTRMLQPEQTDVIGADKLLELLGGTPTTGSQRVTRGVTPHAVTPKAVAAVPSLPVEFEFGKASLSKSASTQLDELSTALRNPALAKHQFEIAGHTDAKGSERANKKLSQQRAEAVVSYLEAKGVEPQRLRAVGKGEEELFLPSDPLSPKNRRVEVRRVD